MDPRDADERQQELIDAARQQVHGDSSDATINVGSQYAETEATSSSVTPLPDWLPGYKIVREIGRAGQGVVYQAIQKSTKRKVAIKVMKEGPFAGPADKARFEREVQVLGQLKHPNVVNVHVSGEAAGHFYFVMDYISGQPLDGYMAASERSIEETLKLFAKICDAVNAAHLRGVIHRDLKPGNIRIDDNGEPHVLDFGLAKVATSDQEASLMTMTGQFIGSLPWSSPEQAEGKPGKIDIRTDVYSLGVVLYQMLTGRFPYEVVGNMRDVLDRIMKAEPARPSTIRRQIDDEVETIVLKCLSKERERRYQTAGELARDVRHYLKGDAIEAKRDSVGYLLRKQLRRYRGPATVGAAFVLVISVGFVASLTFWQRAVRERNRAELEATRAKVAAAKSAEVARFTQEMLSGVDPEVAGALDKTLMRLILRQAAERIETELAGQPEVEAAIRTTLGHTYKSLGEYQAAQPHLETALGIHERVLGIEHPDTLVSMNTLGNLYASMGRYDEAEALLTETLAIRERTLGGEHAETLSSMNNLGSLYGNRGRRDKAEQLYSEALKIRERVLGPEHRDTLTSMNNLAGLYLDQDRLDEAEALYTETLPIQKRVLGLEHPHTLTSMANLAMLYSYQRRYDEAEPLLNEALAVHKHVLGDEHRSTLTTMANLAFLYSCQDDYEKAAPLFAEALGIQKRVLSDEHPDTLNTMNNLAASYRVLGRYDEAAPLFTEALAIQKRVLGDEHPKTLISMVNLGALYNTQGRFDAAEPVLRELCEIAGRALPEGHWHTGVFLGRYGQCLSGLKRYPEAEDTLLQAYEIVVSARGSGDKATIVTVEAIIELYQAWDKPQQAAEWRAKLPEPSESPAVSQPADEAEPATTPSTSQPSTDDGGDGTGK